VKTETAISLVGIVMEVLAHREICLKSAQKDVPGELLVAALADLEAYGADTTEARDWLNSHGIQLAQNSPALYQRRANNQVSAEVEAFIRELLDKSWSKSAIAKQLKVNRRTVIRVARESVENAQQRRKLAG
jgi:hypothetical protein